MNEKHQWQDRIPSDFAAEAKVWVYQAARTFTVRELAEINEQLDQFYQQWMSHNRPVKGWAGVFFNQFIVIVADDTADRLCGSAVDHSLRVIQSLERQYEVSLLDRMLLGFLVQDRVELLPLAQLPHALAAGKVKEDTLYFNNTVTTKAALLDHWIIPLKDSWLAQRYLTRTGV